MAYIFFDSTYAPCAFLIVKDGGDPYKESDTILVQQDTDYPGIANSMGWGMGVYEDSINSKFAVTHCRHSGTDGTIQCPDCGTTAADFIAAASEYIREHQNEKFEGLDEYFETR